MPYVFGTDNAFLSVMTTRLSRAERRILRARIHNARRESRIGLVSALQATGTGPVSFPPAADAVWLHRYDHRHYAPPARRER